MSSTIILSVKADESGNYAEIFNKPANCPTTFEADNTCVEAKILDPEVDCYENKCPGSPSYKEIQRGEANNTFDELKVFGFVIYINSAKKFAAIINIVISTSLGIVSMYAIVRGIYVGAYKRANTIEAEVIAEANKELMSLIIGFMISWGFIFILQFTMNFLGFGSINELVLIGDQSSNSAIVINSGGSSEEDQEINNL